MVRRDQIVDALTAALRDVAWVRAAYLGGSDATGRTDEWSDVDVVALVEDDRTEESFRVVRDALTALSPIAHSYRMPEPTFHGGSQEFYRLRDADPCHIVDYVAMRLSQEDRLLEPERHGTPHVLFDRDGLLRPTPLDRAALNAKMRARLEEMRSVFYVFQSLSTKAVHRGHPGEAVVRLQQMTLKPLVDLLRIRYCPDRWDFGFRYLDRDLPDAVRRDFEALLLPRNLDQVEEHRARAEAMFTENLRALDAGEWSLPDRSGPE
ncbi:MAG: nucleotidyltransferase domain-containing protein [Gemmatimonadetes bacterium]|nr:nucleotidyltransferase domain-containing protein [Gemmatimonadota bacterium]